MKKFVSTMKKSTIVIVIIVIGVLIGTGILVFRERPLIPEGYTIEYSGGGFAYEYLTKFTWEAGKSLIEFNPDYPDSRGSQYLLIDTDELEAILKTAKCRASLDSFVNYFSGDLKYQFHVVLTNGDKTRHAQICLGANSYDTARRFNYKIQNASDLISALDAAASTERFQ